MKRFAVLLVLIAGLLLVSACQGTAGTQGPQGPQGPAGPPGSVGPQGAPGKVQAVTHDFSIIIGEGEVVQEVGGKDVLNGEFHRWEPPVLVVNEGDSVRLKVTNPRSRAHSFVLPDLGVATPRLEKRGGSATVEFTANKVGIFQFTCGLAYDEAAGNCDPDHNRQVGHLIVLKR